MNDTLSAHYGLKKQELVDMVNNAECMMIRGSQWNDILDKMFPDLSAEDRARVYAFAVAFYHHKVKGIMFAEWAAREAKAVTKVSGVGIPLPSFLGKLFGGGDDDERGDDE